MGFKVVGGSNPPARPITTPIPPITSSKSYPRSFTRERDKLSSERDALALERDRVSRERDELMARSVEARNELAALEQQVVDIQAELSRARQDATDARKKADEAQQEATETKVELREAEQQLEQRPMVRLHTGGAFKAPDGTWQILGSHAAQIERNAKSVAQVKFVDDSGRAFT